MLLSPASPYPLPATFPPPSCCSQDAHSDVTHPPISHSASSGQDIYVGQFSFSATKYLRQSAQKRGNLCLDFWLWRCGSIGSWLTVWGLVTRQHLIAEVRPEKAACQTVTGMPKEREGREAQSLLQAQMATDPNAIEPPS